MLQKYKITYYAFILCLFGLTLITVSPVLAEDSTAFVECRQIKGDLKGKKNCFKRLARELESSAADAIQAKDARIAELESSAADAIQAKDARIIELEGKIEKNEGEIFHMQQMWNNDTYMSELIAEEKHLSSRLAHILASHRQLTSTIDWCKEEEESGRDPHGCVEGVMQKLEDGGFACSDKHRCGEDCTLPPYCE